MQSLPETKTNSTAAWRELDARYLLHPFTDNRAVAESGSLIIVRGDGCYVYDSDGNAILDTMAGLWCVNVGYGRQELAEAAYEQLTTLPYFSSFFGCAHPQVIELASDISQLFSQGNNRILFTNSGSEAVDSALRAVRWYWELAGAPEKKIVIARENAYHGSTIAGTSLGGMSKMHAQGASPVQGITRIEQPYWFENGGDLSPSEYGRKAALSLAEEIERLGSDKVAAFIAEPVQGAGGVIIPPDTYWPEIERICRHYDVLLVADEVVCGFGRLGYWFGCEHFGFQPDLVTFAKGVTSGYQPLGGLLLGAKVADVLFEKGGEMAHGFTYSGHPVACAVARRNIAILKDERIYERAREGSGAYFAKKWAELGEHPLVGEARAVGFLGAIELVKDKQARQFFEPRGKVGPFCRDHCIADGVMIRAVQDTLVVSPPLIIEEEQIDQLTSTVWRSLDITLDKLGDLI